MGRQKVRLYNTFKQAKAAGFVQGARLCVSSPSGTYYGTLQILRMYSSGTTNNISSTTREHAVDTGLKKFVIAHMLNDDGYWCDAPVEFCDVLTPEQPAVKYRTIEDANNAGFRVGAVVNCKGDSSGGGTVTAVEQYIHEDYALPSSEAVTEFFEEHKDVFAFVEYQTWDGFVCTVPADLMEVEQPAPCAEDAKVEPEVKPEVSTLEQAEALGFKDGAMIIAPGFDDGRLQKVCGMFVYNGEPGCAVSNCVKEYHKQCNHPFVVLACGINRFPAIYCSVVTPAPERPIVSDDEDDGPATEDSTHYDEGRRQKTYSDNGFPIIGKFSVGDVTFRIDEFDVAIYPTDLKDQGFFIEIPIEKWKKLVEVMASYDALLNNDDGQES